MDGYGMNASMWKCFSRSRMCDRSWRGGSRTTIGFDPHSALADRAPAACVAEWVAATTPTDQDAPEFLETLT